METELEFKGSKVNVGIVDSAKKKGNQFITMGTKHFNILLNSDKLYF